MAKRKPHNNNLVATDYHLLNERVIALDGTYTVTEIDGFKIEVHFGI